MGHDSPQFSPVFSIDVAAQAANNTPAPMDTSVAILAILRQLLQSQERQNKLLEQLINSNVAAQKQRNNELQQWRDENPYLAKSCRKAAESLARVQSCFIEQITSEIDENGDGMMDSDFVLSEFVDRFGPRLAHLNGVLQVLAQLSSTTAAPIQQ